MMLMLLTPSSRFTHGSLRPDAHGPLPRVLAAPPGRGKHLEVSSPPAPSGTGARRQQDPAARAQHPMKMTLCSLAGEDVQDSTQGARDGRALRQGGCQPAGDRMPAVPRDCSQFLARSGSLLHEPGIDYLPLP